MPACIDDSADGSFGHLSADWAVRKAVLIAVELERLRHKLEKLAEYLADYEMDDLVEEALQLAAGQRKNSPRGHRQQSGRI